PTKDARGTPHADGRPQEQANKHAKCNPDSCPRLSLPPNVHCDDDLFCGRDTIADDFSVAIEVENGEAVIAWYGWDGNGARLPGPFDLVRAAWAGHYVISPDGKWLHELWAWVLSPETWIDTCRRSDRAALRQFADVLEAVVKAERALNDAKALIESRRL